MYINFYLWRHNFTSDVTLKQLTKLEQMYIYMERLTTTTTLMCSYHLHYHRYLFHRHLLQMSFSNSLHDNFHTQLHIIIQTLELHGLCVDKEQLQRATFKRSSGADT